MRKRADDGIQNLIEALANIFAQKPQNMIGLCSALLGAGESPSVGWLQRGSAQPVIWT
jgi:hypothetical protein